MVFVSSKDFKIYVTKEKGKERKEGRKEGGKEEKEKN